MHNNNRYYDSAHNRKFKFYSKLIERYGIHLTEQKTIYLYLTSSHMKRNKQFRQKNLLLKEYVFNSNVTLENLLSEKDTNNKFYINKQMNSIDSNNQLNQIEATDVIARNITNSNNYTEPNRSYL
jgi:hypothetical protein